MSGDESNSTDIIGPEIREFDARLKRLEEVVAQLERGGVPLEESLKLFEEGMGLLKKLQRVLELVEVRIDELVDHGEEKLGTRPLEISD